MQTASLELSKRLYEVSEWKGTYFVYWYKQDTRAFDADEWLLSPRIKVHQDSIPAYDLSFLMDKLPNFLLITLVHTDVPNTWTLGWRYKMEDKPSIFADTAVDTVALLHILLFETNILKKGIN